MCGIAGFIRPGYRLDGEENKWAAVLQGMNRAQKHRGPDGEWTLLDGICGLAQVSLCAGGAAIDHQPMVRSFNGHTCAIACDGEIYNADALQMGLKTEGLTFDSDSDAEVVLLGYMRHGIEYVCELRGVFALAIWDSEAEALYLIRDRFGVKPLFYTATQEGGVVFSSEIKGLFAYPGIAPIINQDGLCEIFGLGPAKTSGKGVFKDILEVLPGHCCVITREGKREHAYWQLKSDVHTENYADTVRHTSELLREAVLLQAAPDAALCAFLSGGVDSSLITAICAGACKEQGRKLHTFSFDFVDSGKYFQANAFQPSLDRPYVELMVEQFGLNHTYLECDHMDLIEYLYLAVDARDLPCMADIESSLLYFCSKVARSHKIALTGECADEVFGGYPWFYKKEMLEANTFPWSMELSPRTMFLRDDWIEQLPLADYVQAAYERTIAQTPRLPGEEAVESRRREMAYLNLQWFMATLLDRMDRTSMHAGLKARVPFADHRLVEYIWNVPWEMKSANGVVKGLLRAAGEPYLQHDVLYRKKSPYPKTYHPAYEKALGERLMEVLSDTDAPIRQLVDRKKAGEFLASPTDYGKPWYGQLMAGPQMLAYLLQVNHWMRKYHVQICHD